MGVESEHESISQKLITNDMTHLHDQQPVIVLHGSPLHMLRSKLLIHHSLLSNVLGSISVSMTCNTIVHCKK